LGSILNLGYLGYFILIFFRTIVIETTQKQIQKLGDYYFSFFFKSWKPLKNLDFFNDVFLLLDFFFKLVIFLWARSVNFHSQHNKFKKIGDGVQTHVWFQMKHQTSHLKGLWYFIQNFLNNHLLTCLSILHRKKKSFWGSVIPVFSGDLLRKRLQKKYYH
jgi:hypothetical protein